MNRGSDHRILVLMPSEKDAERTGQLLLQQGLDFVVCDDLPHLCREIEQGAALAILTEELMDSDSDHCIPAALARQPTWSDFPLVVIARAQFAGNAYRESLNTSLVERPVRMRSLLSVIDAAMRSRRHQYVVRDHLAERERLERELREADSRKNEFLAILAHELRNPLAPLRNALQITRLASPDSAATAHAREIMERQLAHMVRLIDDLLDVSRITRNKLELRKEPILLSDVIEAAVETVQPLIGSEQHLLEVSLPPEPIYLDADLTRLAQVFGNLLTNSAKYTERGGRIRISAKRRENEVAVSVEDTGIGVPPDSLQRIFDMFSQVERNADRSGGGLGIGLALVRGLVEAHGGTVRAQSEGEGRGAVFTVTLPILHAEALPVATEAHMAGARVSSVRILVAEDNRDSAESLRLMLHYMGHDVQVARDGREAIELADQLRPELILMDIGMPRVDGLQATRAIRERLRDEEIVIIALTGWGQNDDRLRSKEAGFNGHLVKPLDRHELDRLLGQISARSANPSL